MYASNYEVEDWHWWFQGRRAVLWSMVGRANLPRRPEVLDAGCGTGRNLAEFASLGPISGVDRSPHAVEFCRRRGYQAQVADLGSLPFDDDRFELTLLTDVVEHVEDDVGALAELRRVSAPDGVLLVTVPAYQWLWSVHDELHHHQRRYSLRGLAGALNEAGWSPEMTTHFNSILMPPIALIRLLARTFGRYRDRRLMSRADVEITGGPLNSTLALPMKGEAGVIRRGASLPFGVSIGAVCRPA